MFGLFQQRSDFGILPGGMEEVALFEFGRERVYLKRRKGFIKYALQHGDERTRSEICQTSGVGTQVPLRLAGERAPRPTSTPHATASALHVARPHTAAPGLSGE